MPIITKISNHHTGGLGNNNYAPTQHLTWKNVDNAHKARFNFKSHYTGLYGGYTFFIDREGVLTQFRAIGEEGAHTRGSNFDAVAVCLAGNFLVEKPTVAQIKKYGELVVDLYTGNVSKYIVAPNTKMAVKAENIRPHGELQSGTQCNCLISDWGRKILFEKIYAQNPVIKQLIALLVSLKIIIEPVSPYSLGAEFDKACDGFINLENI